MLHVQFASRLARILAVSTALTLLPAVAASAEDAKVVARVDGVEISSQDVDIVLEDLGDALKDKSPQEARDYAVTYLVDLELMAKKARAAGLDKGPDFESRVKYLQSKALLEMHLGQVTAAAKTDEAAKTLYDRLTSEMPRETEVRARHILVKTEDEAKAVVQGLNEGKDFAELAKEKSIDPGSGPDGGDLGFFTKDRMVPEFSEAAFAMKPGDVSEPVKSQFGWHIIKVEESREKAPPAFGDVKEQLMGLVGQEAQRNEIINARNGAKIERFDAAGKLIDNQADAKKKAE